MSVLRPLIVSWNNTWRYDYLFREKYKIAFNSPEHRELNQIDIKFSLEEEALIEKERKSRLREHLNLEKYKKDHKWLTPYREAKLNDSELFEDINIDDL